MSALRLADAADAPGLAALSIEVWTGTYLREGIGPAFAEFALGQFTAARFAAAMLDPAEVLIVSQNRMGIDGYLRLSFARPGPVPGCSDTEISTLYVQRRHQGQGIGRALLREGMARAFDHGCARLWLATNAENTPAIGFYLAFGFQRVGQTAFRIGDQSYPNEVFARDLPA